jgi:hypothetical protein
MRAALDDELEVRDAAIIEAIDAGQVFAEVARWAELSPARLNQIIARRGSDQAAE